MVTVTVMVTVRVTVRVRVGVRVRVRVRRGLVVSTLSCAATPYSCGTTYEAS